ncbi:MAG: DUF2914 domain-containing protein [Myxococcota bacterium]
MRRSETGRGTRSRWAAAIALLAGLLLLPHAASAQEATEIADEVEAIVDPLVPSALAQFTTAVENREPVDQISFVENDVRTIVFFSDLRQLQGRTITHRWRHGDVVRAEVDFEVGGPRWRVWSSKELLEDWLGDWTVEIVTDDGEVIAAETFTYTDAGR